MKSTTPDIDDLYIDTIKDMEDKRDRSRFRDLVYALLMGKQRDGIPSDVIWTEVVTEAVQETKTWINAREREEILAKIEAGNDEYEEAIASQEAAATIPSR